ncbi:cell envelope integrity protein TolA [Francisellaceae bacterium CB300]|jgi:colicin import membrane protein
MANLNYHYQKALNYCKKQVNENPYIAKAILIHVGIIVFLYVLSFISTLRFDSNVTLEAQINKNKKMQVIQATSISSQDLNKQITAYEHNLEEKRKAREEVKQAREDLKKARAKAVQRAKELEKAKVEAQRKAKLEEQEKAKAEAKRKEQEKLEEQKKIRAEKEKQIKLEEQKKLEDKKKLEEEQKRKAKENAENKARDERLAKAKAEAQEAARKQVEQTQAQSAISSYISHYQERVGSNWIKDSCRGIYNFPRAITRNGRFIKLTGTSGNYRCDQSLIDAVKNTQPPAISNSIAKQRVQNENLSFKFNPN